MKVSELITILKDLDPDTIIVLSQDGEGNNYSPLIAVDKALYVPENTWSGYALFSNNDDYENDEGHFTPEDAQDAVVFWPTN